LKKVLKTSFSGPPPGTPREKRAPSREKNPAVLTKKGKKYAQRKNFPLKIVEGEVQELEPPSPKQQRWIAET